MLLKTKLAECGLDVDPQEFREVVCELYRILCPAWSNPDRLLCRPTRYAIPLCNAVRCRFGADVPEEVILEELVNARKDGMLADEE